MEPPFLDVSRVLPFANLLSDSRRSSTETRPPRFLRCEGIPTLRCHSVPRQQCTSMCHENERPPMWIELPVPQKPPSTHLILSSSFRPFSLGHGFGGIPAPCSFGSSAFRFLSKTLRKRQPRLFVPLPKCRPSLWEQTPLAFECPNYKGRNGDSRDVRTC